MTADTTALVALTPEDKLLLTRLHNDWFEEGMIWPAIDAMEEAASVIERLAAAIEALQADRAATAKLLLRWLQFYNLSVAGTATVADMDALRQESHAAIHAARKAAP